jgi:hypothetical protein
MDEGHILGLDVLHYIVLDVIIQSIGGAGSISYRRIIH